MIAHLMTVADSIEALTVLIERSGTDITADYGDWRNIGFALADAMGSDGESYFHRISAFYPGYNQNEASKQFAACLRHRVPSGKAPVTIATLFHIAKAHGIVLPPPNPEFTRQNPKISSSFPHEDFEEIEDIVPEPLPTFSQNIKENLPAIMQRIVADSVSEVDADILILGSLTVFSACIPNVYGVYDRREVFANLFLFVTARASAGKGRLTLCRHLAAPIHQALRDKYREQMKKFESAQTAFASSKKNSLAVQPQEPPFLTLFVPANSTASVVYQTLSQNNGVGLLFETEGDTLANAFNSDLGNYSDGFRKAFHHESISYLRKKDREFVEIVKPKFSAVLSGTPQQVLNLIPDAENGLFSRFVFYTMQTELVWHDMFAYSDGFTADEQFKKIGLDFYEFLKKFPKRPVQFTLSRAQQTRFNSFFEATQFRYAQLFGDEIIASVRRLGLILFRFAMILSVLRLIDEAKGKKIGEGLVCVDADFDTALSIVKVLLQHSVAIYLTLPRKADKALKNRRSSVIPYRQKFLASLPESFDRQTYLKTAAALNIPVKTAERYIADFCKSGQLSHPAHDLYTKVAL